MEYRATPSSRLRAGSGRARTLAPLVLWMLGGVGITPADLLARDGAVIQCPHSRAPGIGAEGPFRTPTAAPARTHLPAAASEPEPQEVKIDEEKIYFGDVRRFSKPATVDAQKVYNRIPAYRKIVEKGLSRDDPEYWPLMRKAASEFTRVIKAVSRAGGYDLVGEVGSITSDEDEIPDVTEEAMRLVSAA